MDPHKYLWLSGILLLLFFVGYVFYHNHKENIQNSDIWTAEFEGVGINSKDISHDEGVWYYRNFPTCVGYGDWNDECPKYESYCAGGKSFGDPKTQVKAIKQALENGGTHPECPLIYAGAD